MLVTRRQFAAAVPLVLGASARGANDRLNVAVIGVANRGAANLDGVKKENIVALCDVDPAHLGGAQKQFPQAEGFADYRKLFDKLGSKLDAVVVSTPDHAHAHPCLIALGLGKPVYCEKPLALTVGEVRRVRVAAKKANVATQMGTQIHAGDNYRRAVEWVQGGFLGDVARVFVWTGNKPTPNKRAGSKPGANFDTDLWLGPSTQPFFEATTPRWPHFHWRYWWEFGGGVLADFGCHFMDLPFWALKLTAPTQVAATGKKTYVGDNTVPDVMRVDYRFPAVGDRPAVHLTWEHGVAGPDGTKVEGFGSGVKFIGTKGELVADYGKLKLSFDPGAKPTLTIPKSVGHHAEWLDAIRHKTPTTCNFDYSGGLTESVLLGNVAYRAGGEFAWDAASLKASSTKAAQFLDAEARKGWGG
jgi:predicted dehydrogenase